MIEWLRLPRPGWAAPMAAAMLWSAALPGQVPAAASAQAALYATRLREAIEPIRTGIRKHVESHEQAGVSVTLVDPKGTVWTEAFGLADRAGKIPATPRTLFELGSVSKVFTSVAAMQLCDQKKLELDRPLVAYIPEFKVKSRFPAGAEAITVRMLMTHHSGLVTDDDAWETSRPERFFYRAVLDHVKDTELLFPPGQRYHYSSFGVSLLGLLVERVGGMPFADYMRQRVLAPLDMPTASFDYRDLAPELVSGGYHYNPAWDQIPKDEIRPAGSLRASTAEAAHLITMMFNRGQYQGRTILSPESAAEMLRVQNADNPLDREGRMGLGFCFMAWGDGRIEIPSFHHYGMSRNRSLLILVPSFQAGLLVSVNEQNEGRRLTTLVGERFMYRMLGW
jgi:CubicO group peptidase (beta-lactamase class C family)